MRKAIVILLVILILVGTAGCDGGWSRHDPTPTPRMVCAQTSSGGVRCFDVPAYPTLAPIPEAEK